MKKEGSMYCLNRKTDIDWRIFGSSEMEVHRRLDIVFEPCHPHVRDADTKPDDLCIIEGNN